MPRKLKAEQRREAPGDPRSSLESQLVLTAPQAVHGGGVPLSPGGPFHMAELSGSHGSAAVSSLPEALVSGLGWGESPAWPMPDTSARNQLLVRGLLVSAAGRSTRQRRARLRPATASVGS